MIRLITLATLLTLSITATFGGALPGGVESLSVDKAGSDLALSWDPDCGNGDSYSIYRGDLSVGYGSIALHTCDLPATSATVAVGAPDGEFFLVVPNAAGVEGSYGWGSSCAERLPAIVPCHPTTLIDGCADLIAAGGCTSLGCGNGIYEPLAAIPEECDDGNACALDGCDGTSCSRTESVVMTSIVTSTSGFDLDNADGDNNVYTGVDNIIGSNGTLVGQLDPQLATAIEVGSQRLVLSLTDLDSFSNDPEITASAHGFVDPDCPLAPLYSATNLPPWVATPPAEVYSDADELGTCSPLWLVTDADDPGNGLYPTNSDPAQPPAPYLSLHTDQATVPLIGFDAQVMSPRLEATVETDGTRVTGLNNGRLGLVLPPAALLSQPGVGGCPTLLHVIRCIVGDLDIDVEGTGLDQVNVSGCGLACVLFANAQINSCIDGDTGVFINSVTNGDCVLDPRMADGYSAAFDFTAESIDVVEQVSGAAYCP